MARFNEFHKFNHLNDHSYNETSAKRRLPMYHRLPYANPIMLDDNRNEVVALDKAYDVILKQETNAQEDTVTFLFPYNDDKRTELKGERTFRVAGNEYIIRRLRRNEDEEGMVSFQVYAEAVWYDLRKEKPLPTTEWKKQTAKRVMTDIAKGTGWSLGIVNVSGKANLELSKKLTNRLTAFHEVPKAFGGELRFRSKDRKVDLLQGNEYYLGAAVVSGKNLVDAEVESDTGDLYTRLYVYGKNGISIKDVTDGKPYVENYQFTRRVLSGIFEDPDEKNSGMLKRKAINTLNKVSKPRTSIVLTAADLTTQAEFSHETMVLGGVVWAFSENINLDAKTRIRRWEYNVSDPSQTRIELSSKQKAISDMLSDSVSASESSSGSGPGSGNGSVDVGDGNVGGDVDGSYGEGVPGGTGAYDENGDYVGGYDEGGNAVGGGAYDQDGSYVGGYDQDGNAVGGTVDGGLNEMPSGYTDQTGTVGGGYTGGQNYDDNGNYVGGGGGYDSDGSPVTGGKYNAEGEYVGGAGAVDGTGTTMDGTGSATTEGYTSGGMAGIGSGSAADATLDGDSFNTDGDASTVTGDGSKFDTDQTNDSDIADSLGEAGSVEGSGGNGTPIVSESEPTDKSQDWIDTSGDMPVRKRWKEGDAVAMVGDDPIEGKTSYVFVGPQVGDFAGFTRDDNYTGVARTWTCYLRPPSMLDGSGNDVHFQIRDGGSSQEVADMGKNMLPFYGFEIYNSKGETEPEDNQAYWIRPMFKFDNSEHDNPTDFMESQLVAESVYVSDSYGRLSEEMIQDGFRVENMSYATLEEYQEWRAVLENFKENGADDEEDGGWEIISPRTEIMEDIAAGERETQTEELEGYVEEEMENERNRNNKTNKVNSMIFS
ncbi:phage tail protein [Marinococcus luteus]|uniref:phage tail protein n=1 Tax=Marinococcus luteus TaxID=1122204 RepID=UPI002ACD0ED3|nr:phage tail protein [Marinococcus luteus]MDZ5782114.1 phage tail protein [Marinococcus luteus]